MTVCGDASAWASSLGNAALMSPAYAVNRYFHSSNWEWLPSHVGGGGILYRRIVLTCSSAIVAAAAVILADTYLTC